MSDPWRAICAFEGEEFETIRGLTFRYSVEGNMLRTTRTDYGLSRATFVQAWGRMPVDGPGKLADLRGPSYVWAILSDDRIRLA